jgi:hypothetical protein
MNHAVMTEIDLEKKTKQLHKNIRTAISYQTLTTEDKKLIQFDVSVEAHKDQRRKSGEAISFIPLLWQKSLLQKLVWAPLLQLHYFMMWLKIQHIKNVCLIKGCPTR